MTLKNTRQLSIRSAATPWLICTLAAAILAMSTGCMIVAAGAAGAGAGYVAGHEAGEDAAGTQDPD